MAIVLYIVGGLLFVISALIAAHGWVGVADLIPVAEATKPFRLRVPFANPASIFSVFAPSTMSIDAAIATVEFSRRAGWRL